MQLAIAVSLKASAWAEANRDAIWRAILTLGDSGPFTIADLANAMRVQRLHDLRAFVDAACGDGAITRGASGRYALVRRSGRRHEPAAGRRMQQMWNILRGPQARKGISAFELALMASTDATPIDAGQARSYLEALCLANFVRALDGDSFRLPPERNTGPLAPRLMRADFVVDPNGLSVSAAPIVASEAPL